MIYELFLKVVDIVHTFGYLGVFIMTFIESTFIPMPAEITLIPAGYLVSEGHMHFTYLLVVAVLGTLFGSLLNYYIAYKFGRRLLLMYGKYFFINKHKLRLIESFFDKHGGISTFLGRLLPGLKHFISFPAGLAKMNVTIFAAYTACGGAIFNALLLLIGYGVGENKALINKYLAHINIAAIFISIVALVLYLIRYRRSKKLNNDI